jgi:tetratricopeptide (TPR) repeat protein
MKAFTAFLLFLVIPLVVLLAAQPAQRTPGEEAYRQNNIGVARLERYDFPGAAAAFRRALEIAPALRMAQVNLAIALLYGGEADAALAAAADASTAMPASASAQYVQGLAARAADRQDAAIAAFRRVLRIDGADVGSRVQLAQILSARQEYSEAIRLFEEVVRAEPFNATAAYGLGTALTRAGERVKGAEMLQRFETLRTNSAAITYSSTYLEQGRYGEAIVSTGLEPELVDRTTPAVAFADATAQTLGTGVDARGVTLFDADRDGDLDLAAISTQAVRVFTNARGRFTAPRAGTPVADELQGGAAAGDYDNDGVADLFLLTAKGGRLLHQVKTGAWQDVTAQVRMPVMRAASSAAWADADHDGDLDIVTGAPQLLRNNGNATFTDATADARLTAAPSAVAIVPTDFDSRRDIDLLFVPANGAPALFRNARDGTFGNAATEARLTQSARYRAAAAGDVNKDGVTDFFFAMTGRPGQFALSDGAGRFTVSDAPAATADATSALFVDYDNDGLLDLLTTGAGSPGLWRGVGGDWVDVAARALPAGLRADGDAPASLNAGDLDGDGDSDVVVRSASGRVRVWRNDGGNRNRSLSVRLAPRVSNRSAIGAKLDVRAGSLRQRAETIVTTPASTPADVLFGLAARTGADAVRVLWPAGILQAETSVTPRVMTITELNRKPSSCPFLYTWNGSRFEFVTDFMGGGEMGSWAGPNQWNVPDPDEYVRIPPDRLRPRDGRYELRVTSELEEAVFIDRLHLLAVSHPLGTDVYPNEGLRSPAERRPFAITTVRGPRVPARVVDHHGHDVTDRIAAIDRRFVDDFKRERIQGYAEDHWVEIDLGVKTGDRRAVLLLTAWTDYAFSSDNVAAHQAGLVLAPPRLEVERADGTWATAIAEIGIPVGRPQTVVVDLADKLGPSRRARVVTSMRVYWDQAQLAAPATETPLAPRTLAPLRASLRERGFSAEASATGREPWSYDYARVSALSGWKTMPGRYTRVGDVRPLLAASDDRMVVSKPGDEVELSFDARGLRAVRPGWTRTFLLRGDGFSKEMDKNSASPDVVLPLPFHGMKAYPYAEASVPPRVRRAFEEAEVWNTRTVVRPITPIELFAKSEDKRP